MCKHQKKCNPGEIKGYALESQLTPAKAKHHEEHYIAVQNERVEIVTSIQYTDHGWTSLQGLFHVKWLVRKISEKKANLI